MDEHPTTRPNDWVLTCGLAAALLIGGIGTLASSTADVSTEKRQAAEFPELSVASRSWVEYASAVESWFTDHFIWRKSLTGLHHRFKLHSLSVSPSSKVLKGKDGWLFLGTKEALNSFHGVPRFTSLELSWWVERVK